MTCDIEKPILVVVAFDIPGHTIGLKRVSQHLIRKGYKVYFITGPNMRRDVEKTGAVVVETQFCSQDVVKNRPVKNSSGDRWAGFKHVFGDSTAAAHRTLRETLESIRKEHPRREVVIVHETLASAVGPFLYGAPLPEGYSAFPKVVNFHTTVCYSTDGRTPPFGPGLPYDPTPENLALWRSMSEAVAPGTAELTDYYNTIYKSLGSTRPIQGRLPDALMDFGDITVLPMSPSLEYPPIARKQGLRFIGGLPSAPIDPDFQPPTWWPTITANAALPADAPDRKKVVFVSQGTVHRDLSDLMVPTFEALADREDVIVVAVLGARGAELTVPHDNHNDKDNGDAAAAAAAPAAVAVPANALMADYLPYDAILPHADAFVSNAGFGGVMHGVMHGVPLVLWGAKADKAEVCARAERAGIAVNMRCQRPGPDTIRAAVDRVLWEPCFRERARELQRENWELDAFGKMEDIILELAGGGAAVTAAEAGEAAK
ncbi:hypothetical protein VTH06DRAFT_906 [Thermothelomyces fergusii]